MHPSSGDDDLLQSRESPHAKTIHGYYATSILILDRVRYMVFNYGMANMTYRTTFALDNGTITRLKHLASAWHISQAEVVRRAIALAEEKANTESSPASLLQNLHASNQLLAREQAEDYLVELKQNRRSWRGSA